MALMVNPDSLQTWTGVQVNSWTDREELEDHGWICIDEPTMWDRLLDRRWFDITMQVLSYTAIVWISLLLWWVFA